MRLGWLLVILVISVGIIPALTIPNAIRIAGAAHEITDFNGDGYADLAIGAPEEDIGTLEDVGVVHVIYGSSTGLSPNASISDQLWSQGSPNVEGNMERGDRFGSTLATGDFNGDGFSDLAIGVPRESIGPFTDEGAVNVIYGSSAGLSATSLVDRTGRDDQFWSQDSLNFDDALGANFGASLASGDFNNDGNDDLAIGVPFEDEGPGTTAGVVDIIYGTFQGLSSIAGSDGTGRDKQVFHQSSIDMLGTAAFDDQFGSSLSVGDFNGDDYDDLAIGVPNNKEVNVLGIGIGAVNVIYGSPDGLSPTFIMNQFWSQEGADVEGAPEEGDAFGTSLATGDFNDDGYSDLAIGVPNEDIGSIVDAGAMNILYGCSSGLRVIPASDGTGRTDQLWHQNSVNIDGNSEADDNFGFSLASGDFDRDGFTDLAIGVPLEDIIGDSGRTIILYGSPTGLSTPSNRIQSWHQDKFRIEGSPEGFDSYGYSLAASDFNNDGFDDLVVGIPLEDILTIENAGGVNVIYGSSRGLSELILHDQFWTQKMVEIADKSEPDDMFGYAVSASS